MNALLGPKMDECSPMTVVGGLASFSRELANPNIIECRAKAAGFGEYADCLMGSPPCCKFALNFGAGHLCMHPARLEIAARTVRIGPQSRTLPSPEEESQANG
jgi:hypothetical protein